MLEGCFGAGSGRYSPSASHRRPAPTCRGRPSCGHFTSKTTSVSRKGRKVKTQRTAKFKYKFVRVRLKCLPLEEVVE